MAGGKGNRLQPMTLCYSKHLMPIYNNPMIYYPLNIINLLQIKEVAIITSKKDLYNYEKIINKNNTSFNNIEFILQEDPLGIPHGLILSEKFVGEDQILLILGDNVLIGGNLKKALQNLSKIKSGAGILTKNVDNPEDFGVVKHVGKKIEKIIEKPKTFISNQAVTGVYFFDNEAIEMAKQLKFSSRKELEIADLINKYIKQNNFKSERLSSKVFWADAGSPDGLLEASFYVKNQIQYSGKQLINLK